MLKGRTVLVTGGSSGKRVRLCFAVIPQILMAPLDLLLQQEKLPERLLLQVNYRHSHLTRCSFYVYAGIGAAICKGLAAEGANVVVADIQDSKGIEVAAELGAEGHYVHCDVT